MEANPDRSLLRLARVLIMRMEKLSPDSIWARRTSGYRGSLLRLVNRLENEELSGRQPEDWADLRRLVGRGFVMLERAAKDR